jgi:hypothetical protein
MGSDVTPYVTAVPGALITADNMNLMQEQIKKDIANEIEKAVNDVKNGKVAAAGDASTLDGKTVAQLEDEIVKKVLGEIPKKSGYYQMLFKVLTQADETVINHGFGAFPLVDVYQLDYFPVVCAPDEQTRTAAFVNFYLYHKGEEKIKLPTGSDAKIFGTTIEIESQDKHRHAYKIPFADMLKLYGVTPTATDSLDTIVNDFWTKFFSAPNDPFDETQYCHSPWFERCCREDTDWQTLVAKGDTSQMYFTFRGQKTDNYHFPEPGKEVNPDFTKSPPVPSQGFQLPHNIEVVHFDFDTLGIQLRDKPVYPVPVGIEAANLGQFINTLELKVMVLLKA